MDDLEERIAGRLNEAADRCVRDQVYPGDVSVGLAVFGDIMDATTIVLSVGDVARIAAQVVREYGVSGG